MPQQCFDERVAGIFGPAHPPGNPFDDSLMTPWLFAIGYWLFAFVAVAFLSAASREAHSHICAFEVGERTRQLAICHWLLAIWGCGGS